MAAERTDHKPGYIAEIGFGDGKKIGRQAHLNPQAVYIGFEVPGNLGKVDSVLPNLSFNYQGAVEGLAALPAESISAVNMDLVLEDDFTVTQWQWFLPAARINEVRQCDLPDRSRIATERIFDAWRRLCMLAVRRALQEDGMLYIHTFQQSLGQVTGLLEETGFIYDYQKATKEETSESTYMRGISARVEEGDERFGEGATIYTIIAMKDTDKKDIKLLTASASNNH